jgi:hypothetical protein
LWIMRMLLFPLMNIILLPLWLQMPMGRSDLLLLLSRRAHRRSLLLRSPLLLLRWSALLLLLMVWRRPLRLRLRLRPRLRLRLRPWLLGRLERKLAVGDSQDDR